MITLITVTVLSGCAASQSVYRSGIEFKGPNAKQDHYGFYAIHLNKRLGIVLRGNCTAYSKLSSMSFPFIPMPPLIPTGKKADKSANDRPFKLLLQSRHGMKVNTQDLKLTLTHNGQSHRLTLEQTQHDPKSRLLQYTYKTPYTCSQIEDASLSVNRIYMASMPVGGSEHKLTFFAGKKWESH